MYNKFLNGRAVVVAIENRYNDNDGETVWVVTWDGEKVDTTCVLSGYVDLGKIKVDATIDDRDKAAKWWIDNAIDKKPLVGCTVKLKRSRKAPNNTELLVVEHHEAYFDRMLYRENLERITVDVDGEHVTVSASCINEVVKGHAPWWGR